MGEHEGWAQPAIGLLPNGLLPNEAASVVRALDMERWMKAEERTAELIGRIQPSPPSEELRNAVADYVQRLIMKCFPCQVFTFGSVPLKTYLPDGDIDLTAFSNNQSLKDTWAHQVRDTLESEEKNENAEFQVKEVQYIQAEVKIIKCLVENIVVDISFNQISGLCTLCFLEEVDHLIDQNHLFKRSIILIKAWCYYESRILGAHHGLISTYALETLVLYIFHVFNNSFTGPLEVLYRFLEFFSKFDWENFCVSLWGPVPISSLPDVTAEPPRKDGGELLLSKLFLDACSSVYAVFPTGLDNSGPPFASKHFNVIDPLRINNNLGRSVSKGNFFRIRSAFAFGARKLARLLDCPKEDLFYEVNQFFMNSWERHGSGNRPDVLKINFQPLQSSNPDHLDELEYVRSTSNSRREISSHRGTLPDNLQQAHNISFAQANHPRERSQAADISLVSNTQIGKSYGNAKNRKIYGQSRQDANSNQKAYNDKTSSRPENLINEIHGRFLFARTRSSPELTDNYAEVSGRLNNGVLHDTSTDLDMILNKSTESGRTPGSSNRPLADDNSPARHTSLHQVIDCEDSYPSDLRLGGPGADFPSFGGTHGMHQEEQDLVNIMASSAAHGFNGQVHVPLNIASGQLPLPITSSVIASMGFASRNFGGFFPANVPFVEAPWSTTVHLSQSLASPQLAQCFAGMGLTANAEESNDRSFEHFHPTGLNPAEREHDVRREQDVGSSTGLDLDSGSFKTLETDNMHHSTPSGYNVLPAQGGMNVGTSTRAGDLLTKASHGSMKEVDSDDSQYQDYKADNLNIDERTRSSKSTFASNNTSLRSKASSENSWENQATKVSKPSREKRGRRNNSVTHAGFHLKGNSLSEHSSETDIESRELNLQSIIGSEMSERTSGCQMVSSLHVPSHPTPGFGEGDANGSLTDSHIPITPILLGPGSQQKALDGSGAASFAFYPTGPPVPFVTMLPLYNFPTEMRALDTMSSHHFDRDDGLDRNVPGPNIDGSQGLEQSDMLNTSTSTRLASIEQFERKADILNGDFASHWKNLQIGRYCQNSQHLSSSVFPSPVMVPPLYVQGHFPFDGSGKPVLPNTSPFTQFMSSGPHPAPVAPAQSVSNRPAASLFQRCVDELPRYRVGTGTYLPNPKVSSRERYPANVRRGNYSYDRSDHHGDREGSWNINSKSRATVRNNNRINTEKSGSSLDRLAGGENRADRPWSSHRHDSPSSNHIQNGPVRANPGQSGPSNVAYTIYPLPPTGPNGVSSNRPTIPPVVMLYPYENSTIYRSPAEQLEFGSLGPVGFTGSNEVSQQTEGTQSGGVYDEQRHHGVSSQQASLDKPSSPHLRR